MKIGLLADIHGNALALDAVLADIERRGGVDEYWILGDLVAIGYAPIVVLERLAGLKNGRFIRGNTERYTITGDRPPPSRQAVRDDLSLLPTLIEVEGCFAWTLGAVTCAGWLDWLKALPLEFRATLPDGTRVLAVHASPGHDDSQGFKHTTSAAEGNAMLAGFGVDLVCVGHTHDTVDRRFDGCHVINPGCVSNPHVGSDKRASYAILEADEQGYNVTHHRVGYDLQKVGRMLAAINHPSANYLSRIYLE